MNNSDNKFTFSQLITNKQYRAIFSLMIYFIIFLVLIILLRVNTNSTGDKINQTGNNKESISEIVGFDSIKQNNFNFIYTLEIDDEKTTYVGKQYNNKTSFEVNNKTYFNKDGVYLYLKDGEYILTENPNKYFDFFDVNIIENIIKDSNLEKNDSYTISLDKLMKIIESDIDIPNGKVNFNLVKKNNIITSINFDLTDYVISINKDVKNAKLLLEYKDFNLIDDFDVEK